jgi:hypothetical protein
LKKGASDRFVFAAGTDSLRFLSLISATVETHPARAALIRG